MPGDGYEIVAGERRWRAAQKAEVTTIPAIVRPLDDRDAMIVALAENVAREDLNAVEQARAYAVLSDELDLSQTEIARRVGRAAPAVANTMRLLELPDAVLELIAGGKLCEGHGRALLLSVRAGRAAGAGPAGGQRGAVGAGRRGRRAEGRGAAGQAGGRARLGGRRGARATWPSTPPGSRCSCGRRCARPARRQRRDPLRDSAAELGRIIDQLRAERVSWAD